MNDFRLTLNPKAIDAKNVHTMTRDELRELDTELAWELNAMDGIRLAHGKPSYTQEEHDTLRFKQQEIQDELAWRELDFDA